MTTVTRPALLSALRYLMQAAGITPEELAGHAPLQSLHVVAAPRAQRALSDNDRRVIEAAGQPHGVSVDSVRHLLGVRDAQAHRYCATLTEAGHLVGVKKPGIRAMRFFSITEAAKAWAESDDGSAQPPMPGQRAAEVKADPEPPRAVLSEAEQKALRIKLAKQAGARKAPPPMGARTARKAPGKPGAELVVQGGTVSPPAPAMPKPAAAPIITEATRRTIDSTKRPNARHEAGPPLPPDPRWPSFASAPLGVNPDTGRPWA